MPNDEPTADINMPGAIGRGEPTFFVRRHDGPAIAVWACGSGPPIVMVHGSLRDHTIFHPLVAHLQARMTTFAIDRRGFGASGDGPEYAFQLEFDDIAAVVDAVAARSGCGVTLWGHSYGAGCAMGAATRTDRVAHLILYEPGLGVAYPTGWIERHERALAAGDADTVIQAVLVDILEMSDEDVRSRRVTPQWAKYLAAAPTVLREARTENEWRYEPGAFDGICAPTLVLVGIETAPALMRSTLRAAAAIRGARIDTLTEHGHLAFISDPGMVASRILEFAHQ